MGITWELVTGRECCRDAGFGSSRRLIKAECEKDDSFTCIRHPHTNTCSGVNISPKYESSMSQQRSRGRECGSE